MSITSVRLNPDIETPLEDLAKKLDRSKSYLINQAVKEFIARQSVEDDRWQQTLAAMEAVQKGDIIDESNVNAWLNTWGTEQVTPAPKE